MRAVYTSPKSQIGGAEACLLHFGMTVTEAMASGLPVVVTENTGAKDMVRDGENGFIIPSHSAEAIAEALTALHRRRHELTEIGRAARRDVEALTWDRYGDSIAAVYERLCHDRARRAT